MGINHLPVGTKLQGGKYKIVRFLSSGGFGCTYEAEHTQLQSHVALKEFFVADFCNRNADTGEVSLSTQSKAELLAKLRKKFLEESKAVFQMRHNHIIRVMEIFEENGTAYYVMDFIDGHSLQEIVKHRGSLSESEAVKYILQIADALKYVHSLNRLHLDVKPGNIMVDNSGNAILIDFGASKHYDDESGENTSTLMGVNTPGYAPIEQMNASFTHFSPSTDIYSLGATLYKLLTGITPPSSISLVSDLETLQPLPSSLSRPVREAVNAAMRIKMKDRPQTVDEFIHLLNNVAPQAESDKTELDTNNGVDFNDIESIKRAAAQGNAKAQRILGTCYHNGDIVPQDISQAVHWIMKAAEQGDAEAQCILALFYHEGEGVSQDDAQAVYWNKKAIEQGNPGAMYNMGLSYAEGTGLLQYGEQAVYWIRQAAEHGLGVAQSHLGWCYENGRGVIQSYPEAIKWYKLAAQQGEESAVEALKRLGVVDATTTLGGKPNLINGHEYVDLGLSVKWADCNIGASSPSDFGNYYAWGETSEKSSYHKDNSNTRGVKLYNIEGNSQYDVARAKWGGSWRLPTASEVDELTKDCTRMWTTQGDHNGYRVTGPNGNSIFLPAAGWCDGTSFKRVGNNGYYWSSTSDEGNKRAALGLSFGKSYINDLYRSNPHVGDSRTMYTLRLQSRCFFWYWIGRHYGLPVRPVTK